MYVHVDWDHEEISADESSTEQEGDLDSDTQSGKQSNSTLTYFKNQNICLATCARYILRVS